MKNLKKVYASFLFVLTTVFIFSSCSKDYFNGNNGNGGADKPKSITTIAAANKDLSTLVAALKIAKLDMVLDKPGAYTVFAPNNAAFDKFLADNKIAKLEDVPVDLLTQILLNHVVGKITFAKSLPSDGYLSTLSPVKGGSFLSLYVTTAGGVTLNGKTKVTTADVKASNGVIHLVDSVIGLPTIVDQALANKNFTSLVGALTKKGQPDFVTILSGAGPFTVFAPISSGFEALDKELAANGGIAGVSDANLTTVLQYHVASGNLLSMDLAKIKELETLSTQKFSIDLPIRRITDANARVTKIAAFDVQCSNGVIHVLSGVLLPKL